MRVEPAFCAVAWIIIAASPSFAADGNHGDAAAESAAATWLSLVDAGDYAGSWTAAATLFRRAVAKEEWQSKAEHVRAPLGKLRERKLQSAIFKTTLPGAPDGEYDVLKFASSFEHKAAAIETVTAMKDTDGRWRISGYYVN